MNIRDSRVLPVYSGNICCFAPQKHVQIEMPWDSQTASRTSKTSASVKFIDFFRFFVTARTAIRCRRWVRMRGQKVTHLCKLVPNASNRCINACMHCDQFIVWESIWQRWLVIKARFPFSEGHIATETKLEQNTALRFADSK